MLFLITSTFPQIQLIIHFRSQFHKRYKGIVGGGAESVQHEYHHPVPIAQYSKYKVTKIHQHMKLTLPDLATVDLHFSSPQYPQSSSVFPFCLLQASPKETKEENQQKQEFNEHFDIPSANLNYKRKL
ncbi:hypothetical protein CDAR_621331 [Caerostris darwini]|uniref:Uncharacterized protein n=1 Tax=Caerostris darwini TaxID=1538125 RepID=A0AAV4W3L6_9ARAC|nr:hypothetical protein CDAR_621331 [Caerostris darwini]